MFGWFDWISALIAGALLALCGLIFGAVVGAPLALVIYAVQRGRRGFRLGANAPAWLLGPGRGRTRHAQ